MPPRPRTRFRLLMLLCFAGVSASGFAAPAAPGNEAERVVIVANSADADSVALARYYAERRAIPADHIVALPFPTDETITWPQFTEHVYNPLFRRLAQDHWIDAQPTELLDAQGRLRTPVNGHRIAYLVTMRGVPLRIKHHEPWQTTPLPAGAHAATIATEAAVDSELALLAIDAPRGAKGYLANPLYRANKNAANLARAVVRVCRLDGPTPAAVRHMIDAALAAEKHGLLGRAYFDLGGPHTDGDKWINSIALAASAAGFPTSVDRDPKTFPRLARFDAPALYFGWYDWSVSGPFIAPGFQFPEGAIAVHLHSFSAQTLRSDSENWCGPLIARGVTATLGNVWEPYLHLSHHLDIFGAALLEGKTFGEAAWVSAPALSWQSVALGDPLYRPFSRPPEEIDAATVPAELRPYLALRLAQDLALRGRNDEALSLVRAEFRRAPTVALGASFAQLAVASGDNAQAVRELGFLKHLERFAAADVGAVLECVATLAQAGAADDARALLTSLVAHRPSQIDELTLLDAALPVAREARCNDLAGTWETRIAVLRPAPAAPSK